MTHVIEIENGEDYHAITARKVSPPDEFPQSFIDYVVNGDQLPTLKDAGRRLRRATRPVGP